MAEMSAILLKYPIFEGGFFHVFMGKLSTLLEEEKGLSNYL